MSDSALLTFAELVEMGNFVIVGYYSACCGSAYDEEGEKGIGMNLTDYYMSSGHYTKADVYHVSARDDQLNDDMTEFPVEASDYYIEFTSQM